MSHLQTMIRGAKIRGRAAIHWYVAFRQPNEVPGVYVRNSKGFQTELEAKNFAAERLAEGCDVTAGTLNPHQPKKTIGQSKITGWLELER